MNSLRRAVASFIVLACVGAAGAEDAVIVTAGSGGMTPAALAARYDAAAILGLAIAQWIAQAHGGTLTAQSRLGKGSIFTVLLPISTVEATPSQPRVFIVS